MKRFHVNLSVNDLSESIRFYTALFAMAQRGRASGVNHLGFQVDSAEELTAMRAQLRRADHALVEQAGAACCYANSDKFLSNREQGP